MIKNIDALGTKVFAGDVMLELGRGGGWNGKCKYYSLKLWEIPKVLDGRGNEYDINGVKHDFWWANIRNSIKVNMNLMPDGFEYSFKHGMSDLNTTIENGTLQELIIHSNWKDNQITKEQVRQFKYMETLEINTMSDIIDNITELNKCGYVPSKIMSNVLNITGVGKSKVINGEIGIAGMCDSLNYHAVIESIANENTYGKSK